MSDNDFLRPSSTLPSVESIWARDNPIGGVFDDPPQTGQYEQIIFYNFDIDSHIPKVHRHRQYLRRSDKFRNLLQRVMVERRSFTITGRSSSSGNHTSNSILSRRRALKIKNLLFASPIFRAWNRPGFNPESLLQQTNGIASRTPIHFFNQNPSQGLIDAVGRSVAITWGASSSCRLTISSEEIETIGRRYLFDKMGWSIDSMTFNELWTPKDTLFNHIVPAELLSNREIPTSQSLLCTLRPSYNCIRLFFGDVNGHIMPLKTYLSSRNFCSETEVESAIDSWLNAAQRASNNRNIQEGFLRQVITRSGVSGGGGALLNDVRNYERFMRKVKDDFTCALHYM